MAIVVPFAEIKLVETANKIRNMAITVSVMLRCFFSFLLSIFVCFSCFFSSRRLVAVVL